MTDQYYYCLHELIKKGKNVVKIETERCIMYKFFDSRPSAILTRNDYRDYKKHLRKARDYDREREVELSNMLTELQISKPPPERPLQTDLFYSF